MGRKRILASVLIVAVLLLAVLALLTAYKIATRGPVAPTVPHLVPRAATQACRLTFVMRAPQLSPSPTPLPSPVEFGASSLTTDLTPTPTSPLSPTPSPTETATFSLATNLTPTVLLGCYQECDSDDDCQGDLRCQSVSGTKRCVNLSCPGEKDCICNVDCWQVCAQDSECPAELGCRLAEGAYRCVNLDCEQEIDCGCDLAAGPTLTPSPKPTGPTPTRVELPEAGISLPTIGAVLSGIALTIVALFLAL